MRRLRLSNIQDTLIDAYIAAATTGEMSRYVSAALWRLSTKTSSNLNPWHNITCVLDRAFLRSGCQRRYRSIASLTSSLPEQLAARCTDCARNHWDQTCSRAPSQTFSMTSSVCGIMAQTFSMTFIVCGIRDLAHGFAYHRPAVSSI